MCEANVVKMLFNFPTQLQAKKILILCLTK